MANWKKEVARDIIALGGLPFYFLVVIRSVIGEDLSFVAQTAIGILVLLILSLLVKNSNQYIARGIILATFSSMYYKDIKYAIFAFLLLLGMGFSLAYLKVRNKEITKGAVIGGISIVISYLITSLLL
jgi:uncharacterized BrkB/YihY/UPF0761 family membrane protein